MDDAAARYKLLQDTLLKLDPENVNHWTMKGEAKLDTVKFMAGGVSFERDELEKLAPGFSRDALKKALAERNAGASNVPPPPPAEGPSGDDAITNEQAEQPVLEDGQLGGEAEIEALEQALRDTDEAVVECQRIQAEMTAKIVDLQEHRYSIEAKLRVARPPESDMDTILIYNKAQQDARMRSHMARVSVYESGVDIDALAAAGQPSALDQALINRKRQLPR